MRLILINLSSEILKKKHIVSSLKPQEYTPKHSREMKNQKIL